MDAERAMFSSIGEEAAKIYLYEWRRNKEFFII
jgi:hypothetical protein